jgi:hypothetical protein
MVAAPASALLDEDRSGGRKMVDERDHVFVDRDLRRVVHPDQGLSGPAG